jgi:thiamine-phosphate pyrophosphorylase
MKLIVVTAPDETAGEVEAITQMFEEGLQILHLRKPDWPEAAVETFLRKLPPSHYRKIVLHAHYRLIEKYNLKGIHLPEYVCRNTAPEQLKSMVRAAIRRGLTVSTSVHTLEGLHKNPLKYSYAMLSPVFDSISKEGYRAVWSETQLSAALQSEENISEVIALGGIHAGNISTAVAMGFAGVALLGAVWSEGDAVENYRKIKTSLKQ